MTNKDGEDHEKEDELYRKMVENAKSEITNASSLSNEEQYKIVKTGKSTARITNILISLAILLLILPSMVLLTHIYYGFNDKANNLIDVVSDTIYITEPNISLKPLEIENRMGLFSMDVFFDMYKKIGNETYRAGNYTIGFTMDEPKMPKRESFLERPLPEIPEEDSIRLFHPDVPIPFSTVGQWDILKGLPDGTVSELYVSFDKTLSPNKLEKLLPRDIEIRWAAVDTGLEAAKTDKEGLPVVPIGYPVQYDPESWSPFHDGDNTKNFMEILSFLEKQQETAVATARAKSLDLTERLAYLKENGIKIYGAVITGPTPKLRELEKHTEIRAMKVGEAKLWN